jgi:hypothetical protein
MPMTACLTLCLSSRGGLRLGTTDLIHRAAQPSYPGATMATLSSAVETAIGGVTRRHRDDQGLHGLRLVMMSFDEGLRPPRGFQTGRQQARRGAAGSGKIRSARAR